MGVSRPTYHGQDSFFPTRQLGLNFVDNVVERSFILTVHDDRDTKVFVENVGVIHAKLVFDEGDILGTDMRREEDFGLTMVHFLARGGTKVRQDSLVGEAILFCCFGKENQIIGEEKILELGSFSGHLHADPINSIDLCFDELDQILHAKDEYIR